MDTTTLRYVSLLPGDMATDIVADFAAFENLAERDQKFCVSRCPAYVRRSLDLFRGMPAKRTSMDAAAAFALQEGMAHLERLPGLDPIRLAREVVLKSGDDRISWFEQWGYKLCEHHEQSRHFWCRVVPDVVAGYSRLGDDLGLTTSTVAVLGMLAVLLHVDQLPDHLKRQMLSELVTFSRQLQQRASDAQLTAARARVASTGTAFTFDDVLRQIGPDPS